MSTRAHIQIKDENSTIMFYRHSDGYPKGGAGDDLTEFVKTYSPVKYANDGKPGMRRNADQSAGWLIVRGHFEYKGAEVGPVNADGVKLWPDAPDRTGPSPIDPNGIDGWKVGAYEPTTCMHGDEEYIYIIDLVKGTLTCRVPSDGYWDNPCIENTKVSRKFKTVRF